MPIGKFIFFIITTFVLVLSQHTYSAPGDVLQTIEITNVAANAGDINQQPITPHGVTFFNGYMWVLDFGTDRIYRVYTEDTTDEFGIDFAAGESDFNIPVSEETPPQLPNGGDMPTCGAYPANTQWCGGGSLTTVNNFLWNASPVTDNILKIDSGNGQIHSENNTLTNLLYPSPSAIDHDGAFFWIVDWQSNTINKVDPVTGNVISAYDGPSTDITARAKGIVFDGLDLWVSYDSPPNINDDTVKTIYRVRPTETPPLLDTLDFFAVPGISDPNPIEDRTPRPKGLAWDGEFLWHADSGTGKIYKLETDIMPFGITGCVMKNIVGIESGVILSQAASADQVANTDSNGCFAFPQFTPGVPIALELNESGLNAKPFITLNETTEGSTDVILIQNAGNYNESNYGFTATDPEEGNINGSVTTTPNVIDNPGLIDVSVLNETGIIIEYNAIDSDGNNAEPVYRTIYVLEPDITPPDLVLNGSSTQIIEQDPANANLYAEPGATAIDDRDGDVTSDISITGSVNSSVAGTYEITYNVTDAAGNTAILTRTITVKDTTPPEITILGSNPLQIEKGDAYAEAGAQVTDNIEGTVTLNSSHTTGSVDTNTVGTYTVNYSYTDTGGNTATANRTVNVVDTGEPTITLRGSATVNHELNTPYTDAGASAQDDTGEVISSNVPYTGSVNVTATGTYTLTYNISDASGNAAPTVARQVIVDDTGAPSITLLGNQTVNLQKGDIYNEPGATATDAIDNNTTLTNNITISGSVNTNTNGTYTLIYNVSDSAGNAAPPVTRTVIVADTGTPVITLNGNQAINLQKGDTYNELGATATDAVDDNTILTNNIVITGTVDTTTNGTYTLTYNVSDSTGNPAATITRTVIVSDTGSPVISLNGNQTINLQKADTYTELGATAIDAVDDNTTLTNNIAITGTVDVFTIGSYTLTYNVSDSSGNAAVPVVRTVIVSDTGTPVIFLNGNQTINLQKDDTYTEPGATATDAVDDNIQLSNNIAISGTVDTFTIGSYILTYNVTDSAGNAAVPVTRTINISDTGSPVITLNGNQTINLQKGDTYSEPGATATDSIDNDATLTTNIAISGTVDTNTIGSYTLTYNVSDTAGNAAVPATRAINVSDTGAPVISLIGNNIMTVEQGSAFTDPGASATDAVDNNVTLTNNIAVTGTVNSATLGNYVLSYNVSDSAGNAAATVTRTVQVVTAADTTAPIITLNGNSSITIDQFSTYADLGATATDNIDNNSTITANIQNSGIVNTGTTGNYTVSYNVSDAAGNAATTVQRTVQVTVAADSTPPVITLLGNNTLSVVQNSSFNDPGVSVTDNVDNNATLTANVVTAGNVDTTTLGSYNISYNVSDLAGNAATTVSRTVNVIATVDTTPPVITLVGSNNIILEQNTAYNEPGANATDNVDNNAAITSNIIYSGSVNTTVIGNYTLSYDVFDAAGNAAPTVTRTVQVIAPVDTTPPTISLQGNNPLELLVGGTYNEPGYSAIDNVDGSITGSVVINSSAVNTNAVGSYSVTYNVSDQASNAATMVTRTVNVSTVPDTTPPEIIIIGENPYESTIGISYNDQGVVATDNVDGTITGNVVMDASAVNINVIGSYPVTYNVSDQTGNAAPTETRTVNIVAAPDVTPPTITVQGDNPYEVIINTTYSDPGISATDNLDGNISGNVTIDSSAVNMGSLGSYTVTYNVSDAAGNAATQKTRTVNVASANKTYSASPALAVGAASVSTTISITDVRQISDLNVFIDMPHAWPGDISIILTSPSGTSVTIIDGPGKPASQYGCADDDFLVTLDDEGSGTAEDTCPSTGTLIPNNALSGFDGESSQGTWTLRIDDSYTSGDAGTLNEWRLDITQ